MIRTENCFLELEVVKVIGTDNWLNFPGNKGHKVSRAFLRKIPETKHAWLPAVHEIEDVLFPLYT